ncbi:MAG: hypothetical protein K8L99_10375, partial [Anaerolineae bacterium]|nr:hypothetical protein [Anaerolineae bacterium]
MRYAKTLTRLGLLLFSWLVLLFVFMLFTELILAPWDSTLVRPEIGTWQRTLNDFFETAPGNLTFAVPLLLAAIWLSRRRLSNQWMQAAINLGFVVLLWILMLAAFMLNNALFPYPPVTYDPTYAGYHRSVLPFTVMMAACGGWLWLLRQSIQWRGFI